VLVAPSFAPSFAPASSAPFAAPGGCTGGFGGPAQQNFGAPALWQNGELRYQWQNGAPPANYAPPGYASGFAAPPRSEFAEIRQALLSIEQRLSRLEGR
jgi:hypothetical protein